MSFVDHLKEKQQQRQYAPVANAGRSNELENRASEFLGLKTELLATSGGTSDQSVNKSVWVDWSSRNVPANTNEQIPDKKNILKNDHLLNFVLTGQRPQNYVRDSNPESRFTEYPKLEALFNLKKEIVRQYATPSRCLNIDLWQFDLRNLGSQFDVILIDPPIEEYALRSRQNFEREYCHPPPGFSSDMKLLWTWDDIAGMNVQDIAAPRSFIFIWIGDGDGLERGRDLLAKWGYRRAEDIVWAKTNKFSNGSYHVGSFPVLQRQKEHCLVGIRGTLRRSSDTHFIHCNVDTDVIISEEMPNGDTAKPEELYTIIENFCLGKRRLELFGRDNNLRNGWLTVGAGLSKSDFNREEYVAWFKNAAIVPYNQGLYCVKSFIIILTDLPTDRN
ncbi:N6-adenosine-methyltransferase subunit mettl14 [Physocladia obscura]|uniref:N6-adenosine-methyltransferase subunit mettl14 n=1 Tax=Physocladia obscura TaxID=109957 RepID=A0AAD5T5M1_9FUNG|nr:N6-adenosine-methyltransferase subunit mettl14 [Physocladia obscura]